jgi:preprotein translocase subunit SecA
MRVYAQIFLLSAATSLLSVREPEYPNNSCGARAKKVCSREATQAIVAGSTGKTTVGVSLASRNTCVQCIKEHIADLDMLGGKVCALTDVAQICGVEEEGKSHEETVACEKQLQKRCSRLVQSGPRSAQHA